jgi:hypothetical protein
MTQQMKLKIKKTILFIVMTLLVSTTLKAQTNKTFFLGHSLINFDVPNMVNKLSVVGAKTFSHNAHITNGANLLYHWNNPTAGQGSAWDTTLVQGGFENFIVTEAVPLSNHLQWSSTYRIADSLYQFAKLHNPNIQYYLYETWHCNTTGTPTGCQWDNDDAMLWRPRLTADLPKWEAIADSVNLIHTKPMLIIPGGQALAQLYDSITANKVPGITSINDLFLDDIHLTNVGNYFIACVMYGVIHKQSPVGLTNQLTDNWGTPYTVFPTVAQATILQQIAWSALCNYSRDGVNCSTTSLATMNLATSTIYPNPVTHSLNVAVTLPQASATQLYITNTLGEQLINYTQASTTAFTKTIDVTNLASGVYFVVLYTNNETITKRFVKE